MEPEENRLSRPGALFGAVPWASLLVWGTLLVAVYALQELFFIILTTFLLSFMVRRIVVRLASRLRPGQESPGLERWLTLASFTAMVLVVWVVFAALGSRFIEQGHIMLAKAQQVRPAETLNSLLSRTVGAYLFHSTYGDAGDPRYQQAFKDYQAKNRHGEGEYSAFTRLQSDLRIGFELRYEQTERQRLRDELLQGGTASEGFDRWFLTVEAPAMFARHREAYLARWAASVGEPADAGATGDERVTPVVVDDRDRAIRLMILDDVKADAAKLAGLKREWETATVARAWRELAASAEYRAAFEHYYEQRRQEDPIGIPFDYRTYVALGEAHGQGKQVFGAAFRKYLAAEEKLGRARLREDFEQATRAELARQWWITNPAAVSLRAHLSQDVAGIVETAAGRIETAMAHLISIPAQLVTSLLLTVFITLDMFGLKQGARSLGTSRLAPFYNEVVPSLVVFGRLVGRAFSAQGLIALCNTLLTFVMLWLLGIQNELLLSGIVLLASFIPVLGVFIAGAPIVLQAILQPGGSLTLALIAAVGILLIHLLEAAVLSPRIIGKSLHLHPVLILVIVVIGEHLFGLWGLLLGVPVAVYVLRVAMLREPIPGIYEPEPQGSSGK
ncbi:MAG: AI-2E family transporter [Chromatiaceae bacterium]|nr:AI-2E family transporter [Chromatiaceae bacterium]